MIDYYTWSTPNGYKIALMLEEAGLDYEVKPVDLGAKVQFTPEYAAISPTNKIPAIVDRGVEGEPIAIFESGAILVYLAEKSGRFLPAAGAARATTLAWLFWQVGGVGPMLGQFHHFTADGREADNPYAAARFATETGKIFNVLNSRLDGREYVADAYSIADMAIYPWVKLFLQKASQYNDDQRWEHVERWFDAITARAATGRAYQVLG